MDSLQSVESLHRDVANSIEQFASVLDGLHEGSLEDSTQTDAELQTLWQRYFALRERQQAPLIVAVLALAKSGKSTLLNSILGQSLLPSCNVPETARIARIQHDEAGQGPSLTFKDASGQARTVQGANRIYDTLRMLNHEVRAGRQHQLADEEPLQIRARVAALERDTPGSLPVKLELLDTPGPNEAGEDHLRYKIERLLHSVDAVLYVLDFTKLKTAEEASLLARLKQLNPALFSRLATRLFFVVNKVDQMTGEHDLQLEETKQYVADLLTAQIGHPEFVLSPDQVICVSAKDAFLARTQITGTASAHNTGEFMRLAFGRTAKKRSLAELQQAAREMLADSGLPELEARVFGFLGRKAATLKLQAIMDDLQHLLTQVKNLLLASKAALAQSMSGLEAQIAQLQARLKEVNGNFRAIEASAAEVEGDVSDLVQSRMQSLKERLFDRIKASLDDSEAVSASPAVPAGRWRGVWESAKTIFKHKEGSEEDVQLQLKLAELHGEIHDSMNAEIGEFWHVLEGLASEHQATLFQRINALLHKLSADIDDTVGGLLDLRLHPAPLRLEPPPPEAMHASLQALITQGIGVSTKLRLVDEHQHYHEKVRRGGGFCQSPYWVHEPRTRTVQKEVVETVWQADPSKIKDHFLAQVEQRMRLSERSVKAYVHQHISQEVQQASAAILAYGARYEATMSAALASHQQGGAAVAQAAALAEDRLAAITSLLASCEVVSEQIAAAMDSATHTHQREGSPELQSMASSDSVLSLDSVRAAPAQEPLTLASMLPSSPAPAEAAAPGLPQSQGPAAAAGGTAGAPELAAAKAQADALLAEALASAVAGPAEQGSAASTASAWAQSSSADGPASARAGLAAPEDATAAAQAAEDISAALAQALAHAALPASPRQHEPAGPSTAQAAAEAAQPAALARDSPAARSAEPAAGSLEPAQQEQGHFQAGHALLMSASSRSDSVTSSDSEWAVVGSSDEA